MFRFASLSYTICKYQICFTRNLFSEVQCSSKRLSPASREKGPLHTLSYVTGTAPSLCVPATTTQTYFYIFPPTGSIALKNIPIALIVPLLPIQHIVQVKSSIASSLCKGTHCICVGYVRHIGGMLGRLRWFKKNTKHSCFLAILFIRPKLKKISPIFLTHLKILW